MKVAIKFGDNDYYKSFVGVLEAIKNARSIPQDKEKICEIVNEISYGMYLLYQNPLEEGDNIKQYLQIKPDDILIDDEVEKYLEEFEWNNSETFVFDGDSIFSR